MSKVVLVRCENYEIENVKNSIKKGIELLGGIERFVKKESKVLLKPNMLVGETADKSVTTHPAVFRAVAELLQENSCKISFGDSPGFGKLDVIARKAGILEEAEKLNITLENFEESDSIYFENGKQNKSFIVAKPLLNTDCVISLPKFKTHALTTITGAVKNQFGCVPGLRKAEYHLKLPDVNDFSKMLLDLNKFISPKLYIMDAIMAMEGNGPRSGSPRKLNVILISDDAIAIDATAARIVELNPEFVPTIKNSDGYGFYKESDIEILGDSIESFKVSDFVFAHKRTSLLRIFMSLSNIPFGKRIFSFFVPKPVIEKSKCVKCGVCVQVCPVTPNALNFENNDKTKPPKYYYSKCIKCYCCQELCPHKAINLKIRF